MILIDDPMNYCRHGSLSEYVSAGVSDGPLTGPYLSHLRQRSVLLSRRGWPPWDKPRHVVTAHKRGLPVQLSMDSMLG